MHAAIIFEVAERLRRAKAGIVFTGAGMSTESGISDFRSPGGVWSRHKPVYFQEFVASREARLAHWRMKREAHVEFAAATPNEGHRVIARWQAAQRVQTVITQNIDGLHQEAGCTGVLELHGTAREVACIECDKRWPAEEGFARFDQLQDVPTCDRCGGWLKTATVSFGQALPEEVLAAAFARAEECDLFLAIGSSLVVQPAALLPAAAAQANAFLVIINRDPTPLDDQANVVIREPIGLTLATIETALAEGIR